jgi:hypothetical protein
MPPFLRVLWNLPASLLGLAVSLLPGSGDPVHRSCGGRWRLQKRNGESIERCVKCGAERRAR